MAVSIDNVYQKVLSFANKEQRGYITPQQFNLFADQAQMEIFEQYFYDVNQFKRISGNQTGSSDMINNLEEKISFFEEYDELATIIGAGNINLNADFPNLYRLVMVRVDYQIYARLRVAEEVQLEELEAYGDSPLGKWVTNRPAYTRYYDSGNDRLKVYPHDPPGIIERVLVSYVRKPITPNWAYVVVNDKALYNDNISVDFELHASEET